MNNMLLREVYHPNCFSVICSFRCGKNCFNQHWILIRWKEKTPRKICDYNHIILQWKKPEIIPFKECRKTFRQENAPLKPSSYVYVGFRIGNTRIPTKVLQRKPPQTAHFDTIRPHVGSQPYKLFDSGKFPVKAPLQVIKACSAKRIQKFSLFWSAFLSENNCTQHASAKHDTGIAPEHSLHLTVRLCHTPHEAFSFTPQKTP